MNSFFEPTSVKEFYKATFSFVKKVLLFLFIILCCCFSINARYNDVIENKKEIINPINYWKLIATDVETTVYNAVPAQCNKDFGYTASMFYLDLYDVEAHKIIAMERTFMKEFGLVYGDVVKIEGTGKYDGIYQIQDIMNKRFKGQHKIDILVNESIKYGKWQNVKLYILNDKSLTNNFTKNFKNKISKEENKKQMIAKRKEWKQNKKQKRC